MNKKSLSDFFFCKKLHNNDNFFPDKIWVNCIRLNLL